MNSIRQDIPLYEFLDSIDDHKRYILYNMEYDMCFSLWGSSVKRLTIGIKQIMQQLIMADNRQVECTNQNSILIGEL